MTLLQQSYRYNFTVICSFWTDLVLDVGECCLSVFTSSQIVPWPVRQGQGCVMFEGRGGGAMRTAAWRLRYMVCHTPSASKHDTSIQCWTNVGPTSYTAFYISWLCIVMYKLAWIFGSIIFWTSEGYPTNFEKNIAISKLNRLICNVIPSWTGKLLFIIVIINSPTSKMPTCLL